MSNCHAKHTHGPASQGPAPTPAMRRRRQPGRWVQLTAARAMPAWRRKAKIALARKPCRGQGPVPDRSVLLCVNLEFSVPASRKAVNSEPCSQTRACRLPNASPGGGPGNGRAYLQTPAPVRAQPGFGWRTRVVCARAWTACQGACLPLLSPRRLSREIDVVHCDLRRTWSVNGTRIQLQRYITTKLRSCQTLHPYDGV